MARDLAALTGGVSLVDTNDPLAGIDRVVRDASSHYVLTYEPETPPKGTEYRHIEVKVHRPGVRVLARRGYRAAGKASTAADEGASQPVAAPANAARRRHAGRWAADARAGGTGQLARGRGRRLR